MPSPLKFLLVAGARPNFMKVAPLIHAIHRHNATVPQSAIGNRRSAIGNASGGVSKSSTAGATGVSPGVPSSELETRNSKLETSKSSHSQPSTLNSQPLSPPSTAVSQSATCNLQSAISYRLVHTGQHYDAAMSEVFFQELGIPAPDFNLEVGSGSHASQTAEIMKRFEPVLLNAFRDPPASATGIAGVSPAPPGDPPGAFPNSKLETRISNLEANSALRAPRSASIPDWVVVFGDVNSTVACTLVAVKMGIRVAHVEAGLRSFDRSMPEEINRIVTDSIADLLLTPSDDANENLRREGVQESRIRLVGNIMIDSLVANLEKARQSTALERFSVQPGGFVYVTLHRPANVDDRASLTAIAAELTKLSHRLPVVFPVHPRTRKMFAEFGISLDQHNGFRLADPIGYHDSVCLAENARLVLTDSGGLQEETTWFHTPCLTLRPNTERPVTVTVGSNRLTALPTLSDDLAGCLAGPARRGALPALWDGKTAERILEALLES